MRPILNFISLLAVLGLNGCQKSSVHQLSRVSAISRPPYRDGPGSASHQRLPKLL